MTRARKVVFHSVRQVEAKAAAGGKSLPIIIVLIILFGALSVLLGIWRGPETILISAL